MREKEFLSCKKILHNFASDIKLATTSEVVAEARYQLLCLVTAKDELVLRYVSASGEIILKRIDWFCDKKKVIKAVAFDPFPSAWLLVLCVDNTIHVVPALSLCDKSVPFKCTFAPGEITSFVVPFIGAHECPNSQKCPNQTFDVVSCADMALTKRPKRNQFDVAKRNRFSANKINELCSSSAYNHIYCDEKPQHSASMSASSSFQRETSVEIERIGTSASTTPCESQHSNVTSGMMESSTISSDSATISCPVPTTIIWWRTSHAEYNQNRAIIGYSDGCVAVVQLINNCPFIGNTTIEKGAIERFAICKDENCDSVYLLINTLAKEQFKILLEQKSTSYVFPSDSRCVSDGARKGENESEWEVVGQDSLDRSSETNESDQTASTSEDLTKLFPAAKARLLSLRDLGAKKIGNLKMKLAERNNRQREKEKNEYESSRLIHENVTMTPELLTTPTGPFFTVQNAQRKSCMGAIHGYSSTLSIHNIEIMMIPSALYKLPALTTDVLLTDTVIYALQPSTQLADMQQSLNHSNATNDASVTNSSHESNTNVNAQHHRPSLEESSPMEHTVNVISCSLASTKIGEESEFNERSLLATFKFPADERIVALLPVVTCEREVPATEGANETGASDVEMKSTYSKYLSYNARARGAKRFDDLHDARVLKSAFPRVILEKCLIVTSRCVYGVELSEKPHVIFLTLASSSAWTLCDDFCRTFGLNMTECVEFAGDILLRKKRIEQALLTYNIARIPPIKTALKLAMFNETSALRQIAAMALKISFMLESRHPMSPLIARLLADVRERHERSDVIERALRDESSLQPVNAEQMVSDFSYESSENFDIQMSNSAQFHLSNLLFLTLCERAVKDKNLMPLWNFIVTNTKYHTSLSSIILSQSGLYSSALLLAMHRGACLDVFSCLVSMADHVLDISNEMNVYMYNLSDVIFMETIIYLQNFGFDYFEAIRKNLDKLSVAVLERLAKQLNPFDPVYRPVLFKVKNQNIIKEIENKFLEFCQALIETYILILIKLQRLQQHKDNFLSSINLFRITSEERQNYVKLLHYSPISAGFSHSACIVESSVYMWGTNGINCALNRNVLQSDSTESDVLPTRLDFFKDINLDVYSVHCGRSHTLFLTNNGLYAMGCNKMGQLGIDQSPRLNIALQPMLVKALDNKIITQISAGQHHNAVVADDKLFTWGWNVYGQCGHNEIRNIREPRVVEFFSDKKIKQIACGQAHTLVLTYERVDNHLHTRLYAFGSNHFGQLGIGSNSSESDFNASKNNSLSFFPLRIKIDEDIRLIHTNYFVNFAVTDTNRLLTWGLSPPELRIINQSKKRSKANQKLKDAMQESEKAPPPQPEPFDDTVPVEGVPEIKIDECEDESEKPTVSSRMRDAPVSGVSDEESSAATTTVVQEYAGHLVPSEIDTSEVDSDIIALSSGIYHYALVTVSSSLYMWGKNIERQLGRENVKPDVAMPSKHQALADTEVRYVACGADFTLLVTGDNELRAFGNNGSGQCGVENAAEKQGGGKLIRFKSSKRIFRIPESSMYLHMPVTVRIPLNAPSTFVNFSSNQPISCLKSLPRFKRSAIVESSLSKSLRRQSELYVDETILDANRNASFSSSVSSVASTGSSSSKETDEEEREASDGNDYIHYCLFLFQGLYDSTRLYESSLAHIVGREYKIRTLMLNYNYIEAFKQALESDGRSGAMSIKIFEFFTTDASIIPMHTEDIKYFIYDIFLHFIRGGFKLDELERYFLGNLDYYFLQLAFILYFCGSNNNNHGNTGLEKQLFDKFKHLYSNYENFAYFDANEIEAIFKSISTAFHCALCQNILKYSENFN